jgi:hypothetical protein
MACTTNGVQILTETSREYGNKSFFPHARALKQIKKLLKKPTLQDIRDWYGMLSRA